MPSTSPCFSLRPKLLRRGLSFLYWVFSPQALNGQVFNNWANSRVPFKYILNWTGAAHDRITHLQLLKSSAHRDLHYRQINLHRSLWKQINVWMTGQGHTFPQRENRNTSLWHHVLQPGCVAAEQQGQAFSTRHSFACCFTLWFCCFTVQMRGHTRTFTPETYWFYEPSHRPAGKNIQNVSSSYCKCNLYDITLNFWGKCGWLREKDWFTHSNMAAETCVVLWWKMCSDPSLK